MNSFRTYEHVYVAVVRLPVFEQSTLKLETKKKAIKISKIFFIIVLATLKVKQNPHLNVYTRISALKTCSSFAYLQKKLFCLTKLKKNEPNAQTLIDGLSYIMLRTNRANKILPEAEKKLQVESEKENKTKSDKIQKCTKKLCW